MPDSAVLAVPVIARPEASDLYVSRKVRTNASDLLARNPELIRSSRKEAPYALRRAAALGWQTLRATKRPSAPTATNLARR